MLTASRRMRRVAIAGTFPLGMLFLALLALPGPVQTQEPPPQAKSESMIVPEALPKGQKLMLKDGSFQLVRSYERKGDRVRFYSVERSQWEEIPAELVDWESTHRMEAEEARKDKVLLDKLHAEEAARHVQTVEVDASIEAAPGVFLPPGDGMFVVDGKAVLALSQSQTNLKLDKGRLLEQVMVPVPVLATRRNVLVAGSQAKLRFKNPQPEFYMRTANHREPKLELLRAKVKGSSRVLEHVDTLFIQKVEKGHVVALQDWEITKGVYRFTLGEALVPGEYAFAEFTDEGMNAFVWDFGIDAPAAKPAAK